MEFEKIERKIFWNLGNVIIYKTGGIKKERQSASLFVSSICFLIIGMLIKEWFPEQGWKERLRQVVPYLQAIQGKRPLLWRHRTCHG